mgnify:CR=1 FL=1
MHTWMILFDILLISKLAACKNASDNTTPVVDCTALSARPLEMNVIGTPHTAGIPQGFHDIAFDHDGYLAGFDGTALVRSTRDFQRQVISSSVTTVEGMEYLSDGRLAVADTTYGVLLFGPDGSFVHLAPDILGFAIVRGPDEHLYVTDMASRVYRIQPHTGVVEIWIDFEDFPELAHQMPRTLNFSLDYKKAYIGTFGEPVYEVDLDPNFNPRSAPRLFVNLWEGAQWVDGLAVDQCGNLYFPIWPTHLLRVTPEGQISSYHTFVETEYGHGLKWGSGKGGWRTDALYMPQPYHSNTVVEVVVGVPGRSPWMGIPKKDPYVLTCHATATQNRRFPFLSLLWVGIVCFFVRRYHSTNTGPLRF